MAFKIRYEHDGRTGYNVIYMLEARPSRAITTFPLNSFDKLKANLRKVREEQIHHFDGMTEIYLSYTHPDINHMHPDMNTDISNVKRMNVPDNKWSYKINVPDAEYSEAGKGLSVLELHELLTMMQGRFLFKDKKTQKNVSYSVIVQDPGFIQAKGVIVGPTPIESRDFSVTSDPELTELIDSLMSAGNTSKDPKIFVVTPENYPNPVWNIK